MILRQMAVLAAYAFRRREVIRQFHSVKRKLPVHEKSVSGAFGARVAAQRKTLGLKQTELAERVGVASTAVSEWENDKRLPDDPNVLVRLAEALGCSLDYLLRDQEGLQELVRRRLGDLLDEIGPREAAAPPAPKRVAAEERPTPPEEKPRISRRLPSREGRRGGGR